MTDNQLIDVCSHTKHVDGKSHGWCFDGDDPYIVCHWCKEVRDAVSGRRIKPYTPSVTDISDAELLKRGVVNCRHRDERKGRLHARWMAVASNFGLGRTYSAQLCVRFGLNPDEMVKR